MNSMTRSMPAVDFAQASQCLGVLRSLNPTNIDETQAILNHLLEGMPARPPEPSGHLQVLEEMRGTLDFIQTQAAQRYASRPLPPSSVEEDTLHRVVGLWQSMARNYAVIASRSALDPAFTEKRALIAHRRMHYQVLTMVEYYRARREMAAGLWRAVHGQFIAAERAGVADVRVTDPFNDIWGAQSAQEAYTAILLIDAAGPYSRTPREFAWLVRWAHRFAPYCILQNDFSGDKTSVYALDQEADHGLRPIALLPPEAKARGLNTKKLAAHIQAVVSQLKKGVAASSLGLGDDCVQPACARLLVSLYRPWGLASAGRKFQRRSLRGQVQLCADPIAVAFFLEGKEFLQPFDMRRSSFTDTQIVSAFGEQIEEVEVSEERLQQRAMQLGYVQEAWDVLDQSVTGYRLTRARGESRVEHRQLVGIRTSPLDKMLLAEVSWLQYQHTGALFTGVSLMPGPAKVVAVKLYINERSARERYRLGFIVPSVPALKTDASIVVPAGWFLADRRIEIYSDGYPWFARMIKLVSRGTNFDRLTFTRENEDGSVGSAP